MTAQPQEKNKMTPREYLTRERSSFDIKHEFFNGEIFAMVGAEEIIIVSMLISQEN